MGTPYSSGFALLTLAPCGASGLRSPDAQHDRIGRPRGGASPATSPVVSPCRAGRSHRTPPRRPHRRVRHSGVPGILPMTPSPRQASSASTGGQVGGAGRARGMSGMGGRDTGGATMPRSDCRRERRWRQVNRTIHRAAARLTALRAASRSGGTDIAVESSVNGSCERTTTLASGLLSGSPEVDSSGIP